MCEFISWVESIDEKCQKHILFLTDREVFGSKSRLAFSDCKDNDVLGHGAIRKYFELSPDSGKNQEVRDFWNHKELPSELAEMVKTPEEFMKHWGKMWESGAFQNDDLLYIICFAPEPWAAKAWKQLLRQKPSNHDLRDIICFALEPWAAKAWKRLLRQKPSNDDLRYIIRLAPEPWATKAWKQLLRQKPSNYDLRDIIRFALEPWATKARALLQKR